MVNVNRNGGINGHHRNATESRDCRSPLGELGAELQRHVERLSAAESDERDRLHVIDETRQTSAALVRTLLAMVERLTSIETMVAEVRDLAVNQKPQKEWYTVSELAELLGKAEFTVREWCRLGRVNAEKRDCGRGNSQEWIVSHAEMTRIRNHGLLPDS